MDLVIDANILFAAIICRNKTLEIIFEEEMHLYAPETILFEFEKYEKYLSTKSKLNTQEFNRIITIIKENITIIFLGELTEHLKSARKICQDPGDIPYFALALKLKIPIWSNDKELKNQKKVKVYTTEELIEKIK